MKIIFFFHFSGFKFSISLKERKPTCFFFFCTRIQKHKKKKLKKRRKTDLTFKIDGLNMRRHS